MRSQEFDYKNYRSQESEDVHVTRLVTYLIVALLIALLSFMTERDGHPFNEQEVKVRS